MLMTYRTRSELPANLNGYALWLQLDYGGRWQTVCQLRAIEARQALSWSDARMLPDSLRILAEKV
jgi:hypothetical protein